MDTGSEALRALLHDVRDAARATPGAFALPRPPDEVRYVLNTGGFGAANLTVSDGDVLRHVKLLPPGEDIAHLQRWRVLDPVLRERYHAPAVLAEVEVAGWRGLVLEHVAGASPRSWRDEPALHAACLGTLQLLHADQRLFDQLREMMGDRSARQSVLDWFCVIIESDLEEIGTQMPVDAATLSWMRDEAAALRYEIEHAACYDDAPAVAIHNDLWEQNVLAGTDGWWIVDWDDLAPGDPVMDLVIATWGATGDDADQPWLTDAGAATRARAALCMRAQTLLDVVDSLADVVEAARAPVDTSALREEKLAIHRNALARYRERYTSA